MIRMSDSNIFIFDLIKQIKCQYINYHRECSIPAFLSKNVGPEKVVRNLSGSLYAPFKRTIFYLYIDASIFFAVLFRLIITAHYVSPTPYHWPVLMLQKYNNI